MCVPLLFYGQQVLRGGLIAKNSFHGPCLVPCLRVSRENNLEECGVELYFAQDMEILGKVSTHQLKDDGENELVIEDNKEEYVR